MTDRQDLNVLGDPMMPCSMNPLTGYFRDGCCTTGPHDVGNHVVCAQVTKEFLEFSKERGNDLMTPQPELQFPGLKPGDRWCLCAARWSEALEAGVAPPVILRSTHEAVLHHISFGDLKRHALDIS